MTFPPTRQHPLRHAIIVTVLASLLAGQPLGAVGVTVALGAQPKPATMPVPGKGDVPLPKEKPPEAGANVPSRTGAKGPQDAPAGKPETVPLPAEDQQPLPQPDETPLPAKRPPEPDAPPQAEKQGDARKGKADATTQDSRETGKTPKAPAPGRTPSETPAEATAPGATEPEKPAEAPVDTPGVAEDQAELDACYAALDDLGTVYTKEKPINDPGACGIRAPISVSAILPGVTLRPENRVRCAEALALAQWTRDFVVPAGRLLGKGVELTGIEHASAYVCRARNGDGSGKVSEHAYGNALDVAGFTFRNHDPLAVAERDGKGDLEEAFQAAVRGAACLFFTTVLGPGTNAEHGNHLHLDVIARSRGFRLCE